MTAPGNIVPASWLADHLDDPRLVVVDCRFDLLDPSAGRRMYEASHISGASFLDLDTELSDLARAPAQGRHPLPSREDFAAAVRRAGIGHDSTVIAYDQGMAGSAARLWWLLRHHGHVDVAVLDGGWGAWSGPTAGGAPDIRAGDWEPGAPLNATIDAPTLHARLGDDRLVVVDARAPERYDGVPGDDPVANLDPVRGHIPGARNLPFARVFSEGVPAEITAADELVVYCGSGVTACVDVLALHEAGREDVQLYPGSWSEWCRRGLPAETRAAV